MKKILFLSFLSLNCMLLKAQSRESVALGIKGGFNIANLRYENSTNPDAKFSGYLGVLAHIHLARQFAVQPELVFSGQGAKETVSGVDYKLALNYLNLPVLAQVMVGRGWRIETGPQFGALLSARYKEGDNISGAGDDFKTFDFSWVFGVGYLTPSGFGVDARYNFGLNSINDVTSEGINNRVFQAGIFYQFHRLRR